MLEHVVRFLMHPARREPNLYQQPGHSHLLISSYLRLPPHASIQRSAWVVCNRSQFFLQTCDVIWGEEYVADVMPIRMRENSGTFLWLHLNSWPCCAGNSKAPRAQDLSRVGMVVWQSAFVLAEWLLRACPFGPWNGISIIDLGSGTGDPFRGFPGVG